MASKKRYGLLLTLGGAPLTPHVIAGVPGHFRPNIATPVGEEGEIPLVDAKAFGKDIDCLKLVTISDAKAKEAKQLSEATEAATRKGLAEAAEVAEGAEVALLKDEHEALGAAKE